MTVVVPNKEGNPFQSAGEKENRSGEALKEAWLANLSDLNVCSQKGLVEMFDGSIGAGSVLMPYGGRYQLTETQAMVAKLPVAKGKCDTVTMMSYGFDPYLSSWSPYHGALYAVLSSVAKIAAAGGDVRGIHFTFQEYFERMTEDSPPLGHAVPGPSRRVPGPDGTGAGQHRRQGQHVRQLQRAERSAYPGILCGGCGKGKGYYHAGAEKTRQPSGPPYH